MIHLGGTARSPGDVQDLYDLGLQFAEISITDPAEFSGLIDVYRSLRDKFGVYYVCHGPREGDPNDKDTLERDYLPKVLNILPLMKKLDMSLLTIHLWFDARFVKPDVITFKVELIHRIIDKASDMGITICLENLSESASHMALPFKELPLLNLTLDLGHAQLLTDENRSYEFIKHYPGRIKHIHLHDNRGGDSYRDDLHLPPGKGTIDFKKIFKELRRMGYDGTATLELKVDEIESCLGYVKRLLW
ncbi:MAG: sugar phosphate isomerase/epimerase [Candidatus Aminicenantes bacterium]|nr:MAG: sugar phosphate isomerase/epimerase [Candidatus Aminicenantes bacterium]